MPRPIRSCRHCGIPITFDASSRRWKPLDGIIVGCPGQANGHRPSNKLGAAMGE